MVVRIAEGFDEPDRLPDAPHPRDALQVFGHDAAEATVLAALNGGRWPHGWLISGPEGIGKASFAWRLARHLLATPDETGGFFATEPARSLAVDPDHPVARRMAALSEPRLFLLRRGMNDTGSAVSRDISVREVRNLITFFQTRATDGGQRVAIIDAADDMNTAATNALLKLLEEPPPQVTLLLVCHQPARLLPTIRSRCRDLRLNPLPPGAMVAALDQAGASIAPDQAGPLAELAGGSVRTALGLVRNDGLETYARLVALFARAPGIDRSAMLALADSVAGRGAEARFDLVVGLIDRLLARIAHAAASRQLPPEAAAGESALITRLAPGLAAARHWYL